MATMKFGTPKDRPERVNVVETEIFIEKPVFNVKESLESVKKPVFKVEERVEVVSKPIINVVSIEETVKKPVFNVKEVHETIKKPVYNIEAELAVQEMINLDLDTLKSRISSENNTIKILLAVLLIANIVQFFV